MRFFVLLFLSVFIFSCDDTANTPAKDFAVKKRDILPILGNRDVAENGDTIYHTVPDFAFINQEGDTITNANFAGKAYVVDFFFIHLTSV